MRVRLSTPGADAVAELDGPGTVVDAFVEALPLEGELIGSAWSGHGCELLLPAPLREVAGTGGTLFEIPVGTIAVVPATEGALLVIPYGTVRTHTAIGPVASTPLGHISEGQAGFLGRLERTLDEGAIPIRITLVT